MTEKSNELSDKDKVTQASDSVEGKGSENQETSSSMDEKSFETAAEKDLEIEDSTVESVKPTEEDSSEKGESSDETTSKVGEPVEEVVEEAAKLEVSNEPVQDQAAEESTKVDSKVDSTKELDKSESNSEDSEQDDESQEEEHHDEEIDLSTLSKIELLELLKAKVQGGNIFRLDKIVHEIKAAFDEFTNKEKEEALESFKAEGGVEDDFDFRPSDEEKEFNSHYYEFKKQLGSLRKEAEKQKESNFNAKTELLNKLRELVDGEETTLSMSAIKEIQETWKSIGQVPAAQNRSLWASFNALMDRFYDNRSIYFELKELDRKKNLESKNELCEKAEALKDVKDLKDAIKSLNDLHEEFKHIGPVPRDDQESLWQRFKAASDAVYDRRKDFYEGQKEVFKKNQDEKELLIEKLKVFAEFKADRIRDWNTKTKEILEVQKTWEKIGPVTRESGKDINKSFWALFKQFFHNKNLFFKELDEIRATNQAKAEELITRATELAESSDWQNTANALVKLQQEWKKLGPTPEKNRDSLYKRFKKACDTFFDNRRNANQQSNAEFEENLKKKKAICQKIIELATDAPTEEALTALITEFNEVGFVPRKNIKEIQAEFKTAVDTYLEKLGSEGADRDDFLFRLNLNRIQSDPNANKTLNKKEHGIRKQISELENNITLWKNNLEFFAASKTADKLRDQFDVKIQKAEEEVEKLKKKLSILKEF
ncbi:MAG: DUF349 domain-containing protein [Algoriphagus sp.]|uniref:DUF349 domain-containing protein n=1 Tax=Algoriphagus sp. TaxID=1872435 RepID=UPI0026153C81|nr:DUF349 domain-containing protein [Algoriphagus sp.]MDG1278696.1 DUF349 domain-containing protein [Algoriphagus sp.]